MIVRFVDLGGLLIIDLGIKKGQSIETGNIGYTTRRKTKQKQNTICVGHHYAQTTQIT
jgi:hypothetical protein